MSPKSQPQSEKEPITEEIPQEELAELIDLAIEDRLEDAGFHRQLRQLQMYRTLRAAKWLRRRRRTECQ